MSVFSDNLEVLAARFPGLAAELSATEPAPLELFTARSGEPSARLLPGEEARGDAAARAEPALLHSRYDPVAEAGKAVSEALASGADLLVIAGMGLGYALEEALRSDVAVVVAEPDAAAFRACLGGRALADALADRRVTFCLGAAGLGAALEASEARAVALLENPGIARAFPEGTAETVKAWSRFREKDRINAATLKRFGKRWVLNLAANLGTLADAPGVAGLAGRFAGLPAVVLAAGPSLDAVLPDLAALRERFVLVCVDTALRSALRAGVQPDFAVVVDPQYWNARHLDRCAAPGTVLVTEAAVWPSVFRLPFRSALACSSIYPLGRYVEERSGPPRGSLGAGGSVATTAWDFARTMGCSPVYMAGLDLSFPDGKTHARASLFEQRSLNAGTRLRPAATEGFEAMRGGHPYEAPANDGSAVVTDKRLSLYSWWFSSKTARHPETPTFNLSERGLAIPGLPPARLGELLAFPELRGRIDATMAEALGDAAARTPGSAAAVSRAVGSLVTELGRLAGLADAAVEAAKRAAAAGGADRDLALAELDRADAAILESEARDVVGFLAGSAEDLIGGRARTLAEALAKTERIYRGVAESARWHASVLASRDPGEISPRP